MSSHRNSHKCNNTLEVVVGRGLERVEGLTLRHEQFVIKRVRGKGVGDR